MLCPTCGTPQSDVLETRKWLDGAFLKRTRECHNGHRFRSYEVSERLYKTMTRYATHSAAATIKRDALWKRNRLIVREVLAGARLDHTAKKYGLSTNTVSWIMKQHDPNFNGKARKRS